MLSRSLAGKTQAHKNSPKGHCFWKTNKRSMTNGKITFDAIFVFNLKWTRSKGPD